MKAKVSSNASNSMVPLSGSTSVNRRRQIMMLVLMMMTLDNPISRCRLSTRRVRMGARATEIGRASRDMGPIQRMCSVSRPQKWTYI